LASQFVRHPISRWERYLLFAARFGKRVSRGNQGVGNSLLIPQGDEERPRGEGKGVSLPARDGKGSGKRLAESTLLLSYFFL